MAILLIIIITLFRYSAMDCRAPVILQNNGKYFERLYNVLEAFCDISHRLGGISPFGVFSDAFPGLKMWVTFAFLTHFIISIAVIENVPPDAGLQKRATFPH
jgi:hypothetical protein